MKGVILAAGVGSRLWSVTENRLPKHLVEIHGRPLLEYIIESLPPAIDEVILVIGYQGDKIKKHFGKDWMNKRISYVEQPKLRGTADALAQCRLYLEGERFLVMMGDNLYCQSDIERCLTYSFCVLAKEVDDPRQFGVIRFNEDGTLADIVEHPLSPPSAYANTGLYVMDDRFFGLVPVTKSRDSEETGLPQTLVRLATEVPIHVVEASFWQPVDNEDQLQRANELLLEIE